MKGGKGPCEVMKKHEPRPCGPCGPCGVRACVCVCEVCAKPWRPKAKKTPKVSSSSTSKSKSSGVSSGQDKDKDKDKDTCSECLRQVLREFTKHYKQVQRRRNVLEKQLKYDDVDDGGGGMCVSRVSYMEEVRLRHRESVRQLHGNRLLALKERGKRLERLVEDRKRGNAQRQREVDKLRKHLEKLEAENEKKRKIKTTQVQKVVRKYEKGLKGVSEQLADEQREAMRELLNILPLKLEQQHQQQQQQQQHQKGQGWGWGQVQVGSSTAPVREKGGGTTVVMKICGLRVPTSVSQVNIRSLADEQEVGSALGYVLLLVDLAARILGSPVLHVTGLDHGEGVGGFLMGFGVSHSTIWQPKSYWQLIPSDAADELPLYLQQRGGNSPLSSSSSSFSSSSLSSSSSGGGGGGGGAKEVKEEKIVEAERQPPPLLQSVGDMLLNSSHEVLMKGVKSTIMAATAESSSPLFIKDQRACECLRKGLGLLQRSAGVVCGHILSTPILMQQMGKGSVSGGGTRERNPAYVFKDKVPLFFLAELLHVKFRGSPSCILQTSYHSGGMTPTDASGSGSLMDVGSSRHQSCSSLGGGGGRGGSSGKEGKENGAFPQSSLPLGGMDFSMIAKPPPSKEGDNLDEWDVVDFPTRRGIRQHI